MATVERYPPGPRRPAAHRRERLDLPQQRRPADRPEIEYNSKVYAVTLSQPVLRLQNWIAIGQAKHQVLRPRRSSWSHQGITLRVAL